MQAQAENRASFRDKVSTIDSSGKRLWIYPRKPSGRYTNARQWVSYAFMILFFVGPFLRIQGEPVLMLNIYERKFIILGAIFWPQDFYLFLIASLAFMVFIVVFTVIYGRAFCGWICPQTIFMEHVFRRIEYWIEGDYKKQIALDKAPWTSKKLFRKSGKHLIFFGISFLISNIFLAYIIGSEALIAIVNEPVSQHVGGIISIVVFSGVFYWVYARFREQVCTVVCPYGRLQGVLLDRNSVVVAYDYTRGEPRVKYRKGEDRSLNQKGSCIDCNLCVDVCPTGIDIRNGTQLECINCTACIDACDFVMAKTNQPKGLIRYDSEEGIASQNKFRFTKRMAAYTGVLVILIVALGFLLFTRTLTSTTILRTPGLMYQEQENGSISNLYNYKIINKSNKDLSLEFRPLDFEGEIKKVGNGGLHLEKQALDNGALFIIMDQQNIHEMKTRLQVGVYSDGKLLETVKTTFIAPVQ